MDEEHNQDELEERLYAMLHHVDETQANVRTSGESEAVNIVENAQRSTIRRYWRTSGDSNPPPTQFQKVNPPTQYRKVNTPPLQNQKINTPREPPIVKTISTDNPKPKEEKNASPPPTADLSIFQTPPQIIQKTIEILDNDDVTKSVVLESSDEDEVIEVALPAKPTITIESSDEDDVCIITKPSIPSTDKEKEALKFNNDRESASPVPSVVSSVSDDFIRGDCIALNISSRHPDNHSFDFSLHGSDLLVQTTPTKKKRKKKSKDINTSTPNADTPNNTDVCFATPKTKAKQKKQKSKSVPGKLVPSIDVYDSDSNQAKQNTYIVTDKSLPSADVYDSDSNQSEIKENVPCKTNINKDVNSSESSISVESTLEASTPKTTKSINDKSVTDDSIVDLTDNDYITLDRTGITESIVMANVTGFVESMDYGDEPVDSQAPDPSKLGSTKIPPMLYDNLDFDNLKGKDKVCKRRRYSLTTLRAEMEKFYNESWGGEEFNHREIQKYMSRDKNLWVIDPKDRMPGLTKRRTTTCHYCDRPGHRDDTCRFKPPVCYMCGSTGHYEPRCPAKICVNCGSPNQMYSSMCRNCSSWPRVTCAECGQLGHPATHCPDLWRRYHNTIDINMPLEESRQYKKHHQQYCSGCTRRGHLVHTCRITLPFSGLPINSPYVSVYRPLYLPTVEDNSEDTNIRHEDNNETPSNQSQDSSQNSKYSRNKRQSKSPCLHEPQKEFKKKKQSSETLEAKQHNEVVASKNGNFRKVSTIKDDNDSIDLNINVEKAPDFIPISSNNHDKKGQVIQDNEVSDTSDAVTVARIYVTNDILDKLKTVEGREWLKITMNKHNVLVQHANESSFLTIKGKVADQESFQSELRDWTSTKSNSDRNTNSEVEADDNNDHALRYIPRKRELVLKIISKALDSLNDDLGEPKELYKRLTYLQKQHRILLKQKVISPDKLSNSTDDMKKVLKKLNMVLLGQAGLANGRQSLTKLYALQQRLIQQSENKLPTKLRKEIAQHYQSIFVAIERNDYLELLQKYQGINETPIFSPKRNRNNRFDLEHNKAENNEINNSISPRSPKLAMLNSTPENTPISDTNSLNKVPSGTLRILLSYRKRLQNACLNTKNQKTRRATLVRKLHALISCLYRKERVNAKTAKKMKRIQFETRQFLTNV
ncbi:uncharacterized protein Zcchc7 [Plodia interpunctella]|uniref:uncharacterized protein Zcchc7 n=1 Tax=Plodia interpunctella TaxID=58824 RepID=UPI0023675EBC|nr:uncharacterized protein LOC128675668 [Plodia interpunctella]